MPTQSVAQELAKGANLSIIALVDCLVAEAQESGASDVHIDPSVEGIRVRFRIDGVLQEVFKFPNDIHNEVISRIKVIAGLRTDEHQATQDGRFRIVLPSSATVDVRISIMPTYHGENVVLRLLSDHTDSFTLDHLGFSPGDQEKIRRAAKKPTGMILSTGPTGSGKTTTLYTLIKMLSTPEVSIITIEDPIEYSVGGIEQIQVSPHNGLTFAQGLRSILRQDPNIIMVGEIRDSETASIAVNTALTGHLLLSTLHTNDAATTLPRLLDLRVEPFLIASTVSIAIGQRLVRRLCAHCKEEYTLTDAERKNLSEMLPKGIIETQKTLFKGTGCEKCHSTGFSGRIGVNEVLVMDNEIRDAMLRKASASEIKDIAIRNGMTPMLQDGCQKAFQGMTTITEVLRVINE
jgi:type IV pilus assembly protein PilB